MTFLNAWFYGLLSMVSEARRDEGQTMAEYGLILAGIAVVVMVAVFAIGTQLDIVFNDIVGQLTP